jgi:hypothetical protein
MTSPDALLLAAGLVLCCAGSTLFEGLIALPGFLLGVAGGMALLREETLVLALGGGLLAGLVGAVCALVVARLVIFACGAGAGAGAAYVAGLEVLAADPPWYVLAGAALIAGIAALRLWRFVAVVISAVAGAVMIAMGLHQEDDFWVVGLASVAGVAIQYGIRRLGKTEPSGG